MKRHKQKSHVPRREHDLLEMCGYSAEGRGESVTGDTVAEHIVIKPFPGTGFKIPRLPDQLIITVANDQPKIRTLIVFCGDIAVKRYDGSSLSTGELMACRQCFAR